MPNLALAVALWLLFATTVSARPQEAADPIFLTDQPASLLRFSPDGTILAAADRATIRLFETRTNTFRGALQAHLGSVTSLGFSADGKTLACGSEDHTISVWDLPGATKRKQFNVGFPVTSVALCSHGKTLAIADTQHVVLWDLTTYRKIGELAASAPYPGSLAFSPTARHLIAAPVPPPAPKEEPARPGTLAAADAIWSSAGLRIWDTQTAKTFRPLDGSAGFLLSVTFAPDGRLLAATSADGCVAVWEVASGKKVLDDGQIRQSVERVKSVTFAGSRTLLTASTFFGRPWRIQAWDIAGARELERLEGDKQPFESVAFASAGDRLATSTPTRGVQIRKGLTAIRQSMPAVKSGPDVLWVDLASPDAARGCRALWALAQTDQAPAFLKDRLHPVRAPSVKHLEQLITDLSDSRFAVRQKASRELEALVEFVEPILVKSLRQNRSLEAIRRIEQLMQRLENPQPAPEQVRSLRAIAALEYLGTPDACDLLRRVAQGAPQALVTREAGAALDRLQQR